MPVLLLFSAYVISEHQLHGLVGETFVCFDGFTRYNGFKNYLPKHSHARKMNGCRKDRCKRKDDQKGYKFNLDR